MSWRNVLTVTVSLVSALAVVPLVAFGAGPSASATLHSAGGEEVGTAAIRETGGAVRITISVHGLPAGLHGLHIHEKGSCQGPDFKSAGGHLNPEGKQHGRENPRGHHLGDLPNLKVGPDGKGELEAVVAGATLGGGGHSLLRPGGTAIVIHAVADDEKSDPAGNAGARIACGVIELEKN